MVGRALEKLDIVAKHQVSDTGRLLLTIDLEDQIKHCFSSSSDLARGAERTG